MVNDVSTDQFIRWSDDGRSFLINRQEDFAKDVLPRFFKHSNFSSFVRQLNMYGFHKVPHLSSGALKPEQDHEEWEFSNPNFLRDQPDLLNLVTRKKAPNPTKEDEPVDIQHVMDEINTIKRHQATISNDLRMIREDNSLLWQEMQVTRQKHEKHQNTIEKILRFLASVYGKSSRLSPPEQQPTPSLSRKRPLLLESAPLPIDYLPLPDRSPAATGAAQGSTDYNNTHSADVPGNDDLFDFTNYPTPANNANVKSNDHDELFNEPSFLRPTEPNSRSLQNMDASLFLPSPPAPNPYNPTLENVAADLANQAQSIAQLAAILNMDPAQFQADGALSDISLDDVLDEPRIQSVGGSGQTTPDTNGSLRFKSLDKLTGEIAQPKRKRAKK